MDFFRFNISAKENHIKYVLHIRNITNKKNLTNQYNDNKFKIME